MKLQTLYKTAKLGATQVFNIEVQEDTYTVTWGQVMGKMQTKSTTCTPKNIGKTNETTGAEQAIIEAQAVWVKKQKTNYSTSEEAPVTALLPMKVSVYKDFKHKVVFPCFTSAKLNGVNCEYRLIDNELKLLSRGGEEYPIPPHQRADAINLLKHLGLDSVNGEMYCHGEFLQDIMSATKKHNDLTARLIFHIFDFPTAEGSYEQSCTKYYPLVAELGLTTIATINVGVAEDHDDIDDHFADVVAGGYEGLIIRNRTGKYVYNTRSMDVFKYKEALDAEFCVAGFTLDKNGHAVFTCWVEAPHNTKTLNKSTFKVKLKGTNEERLTMAANAGSYIGKYLTVEYEMLSKDGVPQKPVGQYFRQVDANGEASE